MNTYSVMTWEDFLEFRENCPDLSADAAAMLVLSSTLNRFADEVFLDERESPIKSIAASLSGINSQMPS